jgi:cystathionine beta-lyase/cystathionine gamma-synthase
MLRNAYAVALFLEAHPAVRLVLYPGLRSHPQHELAKRQQHGFGSMITFYVHGGRTESATILQNVRFLCAPNRSIHKIVRSHLSFPFRSCLFLRWQNH